MNKIRTVVPLRLSQLCGVSDGDSTRTLPEDSSECIVVDRNEIGRLKEEVSTAKTAKEFTEDTEMLSKADQVLGILEGFSQKPLEDGDLKKILKIQELAREIKN